VTSGVSKVSEMLGGADSRKVPETSDKRFETMLSIASLSSAPRIACWRTSAPSSVRRRLRVERSSRRTPRAFPVKIESVGGFP
jgi:hypothetical protein